MERKNEHLIKEFLENQAGFTEERTLQEYNELTKYPDIEEELVSYIQNGWDGLSGGIEIEGLTAKKLYEEYPLSVIGAYNYLIYLREEPAEALDFLKKGLPRQ